MRWYLATVTGAPISSDLLNAAGAIYPGTRVALAAVAREVDRDGFALRAGSIMRRILGDLSPDDWLAFASSWADLGLDLYMADGGRYRRRRFAVFSVEGDTITRKPHQPHYQSRDYNPLNGGLQRWFEPVLDAVATGEVVQRVVRVCATVFDAIASSSGKQTDWHVEMHQFRIEALAGNAGRPTPEGAHRDGVDWVCVMLVNRRNVSSGITQIYDSNGGSLQEFTLTDPLDTVFVDDTRVRHGVTAIAALDPCLEAFRDVLILTFTREPFSGERK
jgi:hypothetical protein